jgi:hypothetical protein
VISVSNEQAVQTLRQVINAGVQKPSADISAPRLDVGSATRLLTLNRLSLLSDVRSYTCLHNSDLIIEFGEMEMKNRV